MEIEISRIKRGKKGKKDKFYICRAVKYFNMDMSRADALRSLNSDIEYKLQFIIDNK